MRSIKYCGFTLRFVIFSKTAGSGIPYYAIILPQCWTITVCSSHWKLHLQGLGQNFENFKNSQTF